MLLLTFDHVGSDAPPEPLVVVSGVREVKLALLAAQPVPAAAVTLLNILLEGSVHL